MDFKKKYLKYKTKYLQLKNQLGGEDFAGDNRELEDYQIDRIIKGIPGAEKVYMNRIFMEKGTLSISELFSLLNVSPLVFRILLNKTDYTNNAPLTPLDDLIFKNTLDLLFKKIDHTNSEAEKLSSVHMKLENGFISPYSIKQVKLFLEKNRVNTTHLLEDINCIKNTDRAECIKSSRECRWQPINTSTEDAETCYRINYGQKSRKPKSQKNDAENKEIKSAASNLPIILEE